MKPFSTELLSSYLLDSAPLVLLKEQMEEIQLKILQQAEQPHYAPQVKMTQTEYEKACVNLCT